MSQFSRYNFDDEFNEFVPSDAMNAHLQFQQEQVQDSPTTAFPQTFFSSDLYAAIHDQSVTTPFQSLLGHSPFVFQGFQPYDNAFNYNSYPVAVLSPEQVQGLTETLSLGNSMFVTKPVSSGHAITLKLDKWLMFGDSTPSSIHQAKPAARRGLELISNMYNVKLTVNGDDPVLLEVVGTYEAVESARIKILVLLDSLNGLEVVTLNTIPNLHHNLIAGKSRENIHKIMCRTKCNIYFPSALGSDPSIVVSGADTAEAQRLLKQLHDKHSRNVVSQSLYIHAQKLEWIMQNKREALVRIMRDNGTHLAFQDQAGDSMYRTIQVSGTDKTFVERSLRMLTLVACDCFVASIELTTSLSAAKSQGAWNSSPPSPSREWDWRSRLENVCQNTKAIVLVRDSGRIIDVFGQESACKAAFSAICNVPEIKPLVKKTYFKISLAVEHRDFIRGKKDGKIARVIKNSGGCSVRVEDDRSMRTTTITIEHTEPTRVLEGVVLVEEEMPAELAFTLPERYHKQAIGVGGKRIQSIMRRREAYVKFASSDEINKNGGFDVGGVGDNVIVRTPARNSASLDLVRRDIEAAVGWNDTPGGTNQSFVSVNLPIPRQFHRRMVARGALFEDTYPGDEPVDAISELEERTGVRIKFPERESGDDDVLLQGPFRGVEVAGLLVQSLIPSLAIVGKVDIQDLYSKSKEANAELRVYVDKGEPPASPSLAEENVFIEADSPLVVDQLLKYLVGKYGKVEKRVLLNSQPFDSPTHKPLVDGVQRERESRERDMMLRAAGELQSLQTGLDISDEPVSPVTPNLSSLDNSWKSSSLSRSKSLAESPITPSRPGYAAVVAGLTSPRQGLNRSYSVGQSTVNRAPPKSTSSLGLNKSVSLRVPTSPSGVKDDLEDELAGFDVEQESDPLNALLQRLGLTKYLKNFTDQEVDFSTLLTLSDADLKELGIATFGARKKLTAAITELKKRRRARSGLPSPKQDVAEVTVQFAQMRAKDDSGYAD